MASPLPALGLMNFIGATRQGKTILPHAQEEKCPITDTCGISFVENFEIGSTVITILQMRKLGTEKLGKLPRDTQLVNSRLGTEIRAVCLQSLPP